MPGGCPLRERLRNGHDHDTSSLSGRRARPRRAARRAHLHVPAHHLVTHGVVVGMTGSGKTGLVTVMVEEALRVGVPVLMIDVKGDLAEPAARVPVLRARSRRAVGGGDDGPDGRAQPGRDRRGDSPPSGSAGSRRGASASASSPRSTPATDVRVITPGSTAGEPLHVLSSLERRSARWDDDPEAARAALSAAVSLVLRLVGRDPDPARSREHVLLSVLAERRLARASRADLGALLEDLAKPPIDAIGALPIDSFLAEDRAPRARGRAQHAARVADVRELARGRDARRRPAG